MQLMNSKQIKKALIGIILSDGSLDIRNRFDLYCKYRGFSEHVADILNNITKIKVTLYQKVDNRFTPPAIGYRVFTNKHRYLDKLKPFFYNGERKYISKYIAKRLDPIAFAYIWMGDGYIAHNINRKENKVQNIGYFCLESFPPEELKLIIDRLAYYGISARLDKYKDGFGYRIKLSGIDLQKFFDLIYPYIHEDFMYRIKLFYKSMKYVSKDILNTEHIVIIYNNVEDIVQYRNSLYRQTGYVTSDR